MALHLQLPKCYTLFDLKREKWKPRVQIDYWLLIYHWVAKSPPARLQVWSFGCIYIPSKIFGVNLTSPSLPATHMSYEISKVRLFDPLFGKNKYFWSVKWTKPRRCSWFTFMENLINLETSHMICCYYMSLLLLLESRQKLRFSLGKTREEKCLLHCNTIRLCFV